MESGIGKETAGIDQGIRPLVIRKKAIKAVPGNARLVFNHGGSSSHQSIKEGRFADVRAANNGYFFQQLLMKDIERDVDSFST